MSTVRIEDALTEEEIAKFQTSHGTGNFGAVLTVAGVVVVRKPLRPEYKRFVSQSSTDRLVAQENLVKACILKPTAVEFESWLDKYPAISAGPANLALELAGLEGDPETKKY